MSSAIDDAEKLKAIERVLTEKGILAHSPIYQHSDVMNFEYFRGRGDAKAYFDNVVHEALKLIRG
ncbi:MAG TPA: hypothetical protein VN622_14220 [Clostridia bacterium]|nr:hypothetical protein [Clostridia bacterium]